jgi:hypothetical protein
VDELVNDLRYAQTANVMVRLHLITGEERLAAIAEVSEEGDWFKIIDPQDLADVSTTRRIRVDDVSSVAVTDIQGPRRG